MVFYSYRTERGRLPGEVQPEIFQDRSHDGDRIKYSIAKSSQSWRYDYDRRATTLRPSPTSPTASSFLTYYSGAVTAPWCRLANAVLSILAVGEFLS